MPACYFFVIDVSAGAVGSGMLAVVCETIKGALERLPGGERTQIGFLTFDRHLHYYNLSAPNVVGCCHSTYILRGSKGMQRTKSLILVPLVL